MFSSIYLVQTQLDITTTKTTQQGCETVHTWHRCFCGSVSSK